VVRVVAGGALLVVVVGAVVGMWWIDVWPWPRRRTHRAAGPWSGVGMAAVAALSLASAGAIGWRGVSDGVAQIRRDGIGDRVCSAARAAFAGGDVQDAAAAEALARRVGRDEGLVVDATRAGADGAEGVLLVTYEDGGGVVVASMWWMPSSGLAGC
jgi:hypothetical protein